MDEETKNELERRKTSLDPRVASETAFWLSVIDGMIKDAKAAETPPAQVNP